jgi:hypothetical protein
MSSPHRDRLRLQGHISDAYHTLRLGIGILGGALPLLVWLRGQYPDGAPVMSSISAYYHSSSRDVFVGVVCAIGVFLILYKGYSRRENLALDLAGWCAILAAMFPPTAPGAAAPQITVHAVSAILFFLCLAYVSWFRAADTLSLIRDARKARLLRHVYRLIGFGMVVIPAAAAIIGTLWQPVLTIFWVEVVAVSLFAAYWLIKSIEIKATNADYLARAGKLRFAPRGDHPGRVIQIEPEGDQPHWDDRVAVVEGSLVSRD